MGRVKIMPIEEINAKIEKIAERLSNLEGYL